MFKIKNYLITVLIAIIISIPFTSYAYYNTADATNISANSSITGQIRYPNERNVYVMGTPSYGLVSIEFKYPMDVNKVSWRILVLANGHEQIINEKNSPDDPIIGENRVHYLKKFRTNISVFIAVTSFDNFNSSKYTLTINHESESTDNTELEFTNNGFAYCPKVDTSKDYRANLYNAHDIDIFATTLLNDGQIEVVFTTISKICKNAFTIQLLNDDKHVVAQKNNLEGEKTILLVPNLKSGLYFIKIFSADNYSNDDYILRIENMQN